MKSLPITIILVCMTLLFAGCTRVKPYEREALADPIMNFTRDPLSLQYLNHVYEVREASRGATTTDSGGCGCN
jgi:hypothetical protein